MVNVGVIGLGSIAEKHLESYNNNSETEIKYICDIDKNRRLNVGEKYNVNKSYKHAKELLERKDLDLVSICTPPYTHKDIVIKSVKTNTSFLCEKPLGVNINDVREMISAVENTDIVAAGGYALQFHPAFMRSIKIIKNNIIGDVKHINVSYYANDLPTKNWNLDPNKSGGGALIGLLPHILSFILRFVKVKYSKSISIQDANIKRFAAPNIETDITIEGNIKNITFNIETGYSRHKGKKFTIIGKRGELNIDFEFVKLTAGNTNIQYSNGGLPTLEWKPLKAYNYPTTNVDMHNKRINSFVDSVLGDKSNAAPIHDSLIILTAVQQAYQLTNLDTPLTK